MLHDLSSFLSPSTSHRFEYLLHDFQSAGFKNLSKTTWKSSGASTVITDHGDIPTTCPPTKSVCDYGISRLLTFSTVTTLWMTKEIAALTSVPGGFEAINTLNILNTVVSTAVGVDPLARSRSVESIAEKTGETTDYCWACFANPDLHWVRLTRI